MDPRPAMLAALLVPLAARADPPVAGSIETDEARIEVLAQPVRVGERVELPEGWYRVEEAGPEDQEIGSFSVVAAGSAFAATSPYAPATVEPDPSGPGDAPRAQRSVCRAERSAYLAELWREMGIESVRAPLEVMEGLEGEAFAPGLSKWWLALTTDPFRPLAWSSELRSRADALARCTRTR